MTGWQLPPSRGLSGASKMTLATLQRSLLQRGHRTFLLDGEVCRAGWAIVHVPYYRWWRNGWLNDRNDSGFQKTVSQLFAELRFCLGIIQ